MQALDELVTRWRKNPDSEATLALCAHLGTSNQSDLMREVGNAAEAWHRDNHPVMLSVGRMYLDAGLLAEAQAAFVQAGKLAPNGTDAYRFLGEVLLRRGDAVRGEKAIARAIKLGDKDATTRLWHERSVVYSALQQRRGIRAVADEVARTAPLQPSIPAPTLNPFEAAPPQPARGARRSRPPAAPARPTGPRRSSPPTARRRPSVPPTFAGRPAIGSAKSAPLETLLMGRSPLPLPQIEAPVHPPSPFFPSDSHAPDARARKRAGGQPLQVSTHSQAQPAPAAPRSQKARERAPFFPPEPPPPAPVESEPLPSDPFRGTFPVEPPPSLRDASNSLLGPGPVSLIPEPLSPTETDSEDVGEHPHTWSGPGVDASDALNPSPEAVLLSLAQVGLYETKSAVVPAWEAAPRTPRRRLWLAATGLALTLGIGVGGYKYAANVQGQRLAQAQQLGTNISSQLESATKANLTATEADFQTLFELDSRGREAALLWLENRALHTFFGDGSVSGIESALQRARAVGIDESRVVFGRLASALSAGDLPGAGQIIAEWDTRAKDDAWYQLLAGAVFERAGNSEALERYSAAAALQPNLKLAQLLTARLGLLQLAPAEAKVVVERALARLGAGPESELLRGLEWATLNTEAPAPALPVESALANHPAFFGSTLGAIEGVKAVREGRAADAAAAFKRGLAPSSTPALAAWIGYQALDAGDVDTARAAAVEAMKMSALHTGNQTLAVRIALAEGRLRQARDAAATLEQSSTEAVLVEAVSAYEGLRGADVTRLLAAASANLGSSTHVEALRASEKILGGRERAQISTLERFARKEQVWGALIACDLALDHGQLDFAQSLLKTQSWDAARPSQALRMLRLHRYRGEVDAALELIQALTDPANVSARSLTESVLALTDASRVAAAAGQLSQNRDRAGDFAPWLEALIDAASEQRAHAAKTLAGLELPAKSEPVLLQVVALRALAAAKDKRAPKYHAQLAGRLPMNPDVQLAGKLIRPGR